MPPKEVSSAAATVDQDTANASAAAAPPLAATMRHRRDTKGAALASKSAETHSAKTPDAKTSSKTPSQLSPSDAAPHMFTLRNVSVSALFLSGTFLLLLGALVLVQLVTVDAMDLSQTEARMAHAGRGKVWFPVWIGNLIVDSFTAAHFDLSSEGDGGSYGAPGEPGRGSFVEAGAASSRTIPGPAPPPPPPRVNAKTTAAPADSSAKEGGPPDTLAKPSKTSGADVPYVCYTLEAYSETFLEAPSHRPTRRPVHLFSCGTRIVDMRTEARPPIVEACQSHTVFSAEGGRDGEARRSSFPELRVVLRPQEEKWHRAIQPVNAVTQRILLDRVNDDYCDCLDGTDELLTNACSMAGPLTPAAGSRWKSYLISNQAIRLYEDPDTVEQQDTESRGFPPTPRKRGDVVDRLYVSPGPVLPFVCSCGTTRQLLAPSLVGDGVVDCCHGEDEALLQGHPYASSAVSPDADGSLDGETRKETLSRERHAMEQRWKQRQAAVAAQLDLSVSYADPLYPYHTSARALLVDRGYYSLFPAEVVQQERQDIATAMKALYARGHRTQRLRVQKGWERLGQYIMENRTRLQLQLANVTRELEALTDFIRSKMSAARTNDPVAAGVAMEHLHRYEQLGQAYQGLNMELQHLSITTVHHAYGDHYEYYPLVRRLLSIAAENVTDANTPAHLATPLAQDRAARVLSPSQLGRMAQEAQQRMQQQPTLHVDNVTATFYGLEIMRHTMLAQKFDAAEAPYVAQQLGLRPPHDYPGAPFDPHVLDNITDPFMRSPVLPLGSWQPYQSARDAHTMQLADPAGDVHLPRRAFITAHSPLYRGGGRLQLPTRHPEPPRYVSIGDEEEEKKTIKDKLKAAADGKDAKVTRVGIPYHFHTPSVFAVDTFVGPLRCEEDPVPDSTRYRRPPSRSDDDVDPTDVLKVYVSFMCDTKDRILFWGKNGRCRQEVVVGTPSACTAWALRAANDHLKELTARARRHEARA